MPPTKHRVTLDEVKVGQPLPWDVYGQDGVLLLRRGQTVQSQRGLERLIVEGLLVQNGSTAPARGESNVVEEKPSALKFLVDARRILNNIFEQKPENLGDFASRMEKLVQAVRSACDSHPRVALSTILLLHDKYTSTVKHAIDTAILSRILARELGQDEAAQRSIVAAALRDLYIKHGQKIDVAVAGTMIRVIGIYPIGTLVRLKSGEIGVVTGEGEGPDTPAVHVIVGRSGVALDVAAARKTHLAEFAIEDVLTIDKLSIPVRLGVIWGKDAKLS